MEPKKVEVDLKKMLAELLKLGQTLEKIKQQINDLITQNRGGGKH